MIPIIRTTEVIHLKRINNKLINSISFLIVTIGGRYHTGLVRLSLPDNPVSMTPGNLEPTRHHHS